MKNTADEYVVAFLNSEGGSILWGITDTRQVVGVSLDNQKRDSLRTVVAQKLSSIQPNIDPTRYKIIIHSIYDDNDKLIPDLTVVEIKVPLIKTKDPFYTSSGDAFVRVDGSIRKISGPALTDWIKERHNLGS
ncbi:MAG: ATP-binding protein [Microcoleaceae cyanobacterium MO_207.B10]|nr:ATP-binding protein [Microcoleaceae cyanobacterium MO_207.B10]